ncbi:chemotaxis protein CheY [Microbacterium sp.]|uniref:chemotaxis protein CheY n=1 Tax=Microbacterium sp. TaxID=51671 RepID=UPI003C785026
MRELRLAWAPCPPERIARRAIAWDLVRGLLAEAGHADAELSNPCARCGSPHGPVRIAGAPWLASVSYAGGIAVAAILPATVAAFGMDAEPLVDPVRDSAGPVPGGLLHWVRIEAAVKADGRGLRVNPEEVVVAETAGGGWQARLPGTATVYSGREVTGPPGVLVAVAVGG